MQKQIKKLGIFYREDNAQAKKWERKISELVKLKFPKIEISNKNPDVLLVLGGDGTITEAARNSRNGKPLLLGLNLGTFGFLATIREPRHFLPGIIQTLRGQYQVVKKITLEARVVRKGRVVFNAEAFNEFVVQHLIGVVELSVSINGADIQFIKGNGVLVSTASGSTAYNLSAHGPIVVPDLQCMVITELLDHNLPTPSMVIKDSSRVEIKIINFREKKLLVHSSSGENMDVILTADDQKIFSLKPDDLIKIKRAPLNVSFIEFDDGHFFKSLKEKFAFK